MQHVIVILGGECAARDDGLPCVLGVIGPFASRSDAKAFLAHLPAAAGETPHLMAVRAPDQWLPPDQAAVGR